MTAQPAGEESFDAAVAPQAVEASAGLRLDQPIEEAVRCARFDRRWRRGERGDSRAAAKTAATDLSGDETSADPTALLRFRDRFGNAPQIRGMSSVPQKVSSLALASLLRGLFKGCCARTVRTTRDRDRVSTTRDACCERPDPVPPPPAIALPTHHALSGACGGTAIPVKRIKVVTLTAMAPITEKIVCQVADRMAN